MQITLLGAAGEVTGSGYLVETRSARVLVDCGMFQGSRKDVSRNPELGPVEPLRLDAVVLTHAHLDHCGRLPLLLTRGFRGRIHATPATVDFAQLVLNDAARIQESDRAKENRRRQRRGQRPIAPLYRQEDVDALQDVWSELPYEQNREIAPGISIRLFDSGHILGSASVEMTIRDRGAAAPRVIVFSGDIGPKNSPILRDPILPLHADVVFEESTYGDRDHRSLSDTVDEFHQILTSAIQHRSKVLIPTFAIGRSQQILYHIAELVRSRNVPEFPVYLDSPMAIKATRLYLKHQGLFDEDAQALMKHGQIQDDLKLLRFTEKAEESKALNESWDMAVILAGSGMCDGGRILHHLRHNLWRRNVSVLIVGYQSEGSLGRQLVSGKKEVRIFGEKILVRAQVHTLGGFSAHAGQTELLDWAGAVAADRPRMLLTHGEPDARQALAELMLKRHGIAAEQPQAFEPIVIH